VSMSWASSGTHAYTTDPERKAESNSLRGCHTNISGATKANSNTIGIRMSLLG
jgi:hypothetical protein